ncbi:MAG: tRNA isopentenyl-2-thiomethyl-A-37 hydroxylase MiaE [Planctomycetota bacterium]
MVDTSRTADLPLRVATPDAWADEALREPLELLNDHAHLEKKAAQNALFLLNRWPDPTPPENWVQVMNAVARDEIDHLGTVTKLIARRGGRLTKGHRNGYANALRDLIQLGRGNVELMDRLMVSALIEARSCERFEILGRHATDDVLQKLYEELWASEHGHYLVFIDLARQVVDEETVTKRWDEILDLEAEIIQAQAPGPRMHSWPALATV